MFFSAKLSLHFCDPFEDTELDKQPLVLHLDPIEGMGCFLTAETFNQGHRLSCGVLMLRGSSAHSINDCPSLLKSLDLLDKSLDLLGSY